MRVVRKITKYLENKGILEDKRTLMLRSFREMIFLDKDRGELIAIDKKVSTLIDGKASVTKQVLIYIY
ncbi:hypothetical protein A9P44_05370 [Paenibacillus polymyxa]|nr:hypothetical protein A9P44_05370 [Paenibacillus polymyxa]